MASDLERYLASPEGKAALAASGGASAGPSPLGSFINPRQGPAPSAPGQTRSVVFKQADTYIEGDEWAQFVGLSPEAAWTWQKRLTAAGLLKGEFRRGQWDEQSAAAMASAMAYGNAWGTSYADAINRLATAPQQDTDGGGQVPPRAAFVQQPYQQLTPDMLAQEVKGFVRDRLGREPDDVDMSTLTDALARFHRRDYETQVGAERDYFGRQQDAARNADEAALAGADAAAPVGAGGEFDATGPDAVAAAFAEEFESLYAGEIDRNARIEEGADNEQGFLSSILASDRAIGAI